MTNEYRVQLTDAQAERLIATANALNAHGVQTLAYVEGDTQRGYCGNVLVHIADQIAAERDRNRPLAVGDRVKAPRYGILYGEILALHDGSAWVARNGNQYPPFTISVDKLVRVS